MINFDNVEDWRKAHNYHFEKFIESKDFKHFEAAKAIATQIIQYERSVKAFRFSIDLEKMYFASWSNS